MWGSDVLNECLSNADASSRAETYKKLFGNMTSRPSLLSEDNSADTDKSSLLPLAMKVAAKTIGYDLVSSIDDEFSEIAEDGELIEPKNEGMSAPLGKLLYMESRI